MSVVTGNLVQLAGMALGGLLLSIGYPLSLVLRLVLWRTLGGGWISLALVLRGIIWALVGYALLSYSETRDRPVDTRED